MDEVTNERSNKVDEEKSDTSNGDIDKVTNERSNKKDEKESNCVITAFPSCLRWRQLSTDQQLQLLSDVKDRELEAYGKRREISGKHAYLTTEILHSDITMKILVSAKDLPRSDGFLSWYGHHIVQCNWLTSSGSTRYRLCLTYRKS